MDSISANLLIVIPARNEQSTIGPLVAALRERDYEVIVVNDASDDQTALYAEQAGAGVLNAPFTLGAWGATQAGIRYAQARGYRQVITMDADGQHSPDSIPALLKPLHDGRADLSIGSCVGRASRSRRAAWYLFRNLAHLQLMDLTSGLRAYSSRAVELATSRQATMLDFQDVGVLVLMQRHGLRVIEVPVEMGLRGTGKSRVFYSWLRVLGYLMQTGVLAVAKLAVRQRFFNKPKTADKTP